MLAHALSILHIVELLVPVGSDLHDASLGPTAYGDALGIIWPIFLGYDVLQYGQLVIINVEEIVLFVLVVVEVDDAEVVRGTLVIPMLPIIQIVVIRLPVMLVVAVLLRVIEVVVVRGGASSILVEVPFKDEEITFVVLPSGSLPAHSVDASMIVVEALYDLIFKGVEDVGVLVVLQELAAMRGDDFTLKVLQK